MARRSLRPQLNQIRAWVRQGRTDAWIAHQLEVTVQQIAAFKRENDLAPDSEATPEAVLEGDDEIDLRAADDARIAAELEAAEARSAEEEAQQAAEEAEKREAAAKVKEEAEEGAEEADENGGARPRRRRRTGRGRRKAAGSPLEGTFDHGEEGYGLWLDPAVQDDPVYAEHWAGHRPIEVTIEEDQIVIRRAGASDDEE
jgi:hypothetical protein